MITQDNVKLSKGDKVWRIIDDEVQEGRVTNVSGNCATVQWPHECYHKSFEAYNYPYDELFDSEQNAIQAIIDELNGKVNDALQLIESFRRRMEGLEEQK